MISKPCSAYYTIRNRDGDTKSMNSFIFHCVDPNRLSDRDYEFTVELKDGVVTCSSTLTEKSVTFKNRSKEEILRSGFEYEEDMFDIDTPEGRILMYTQYQLYELDDSLEMVMAAILDAVIVDLLLGREIKYFTTIRIEPGIIHVNRKTYDLPTSGSGLGEFDLHALIP